MSTNPVFPIGTSNPADLALGLPLFPQIGTARAGISASARSYKLIDVSLTIAFTRLKISAYAGYGFGLCGPALAFLSKNVSMTRANDVNNRGQLALRFNEGLFIQAGAFVGAYATGGLTVTMQVYLPKPWYKLWSWSWQTAFTIDKDFQVDLLALLVKVIQYLLSKSKKGTFTRDLQQKLKAAQPFVTSFSLDDIGGSSTAVTRNLQAVPEVTAPFNIVNYVPKLKAANDALGKIGGEISVGPTAHLQFPVTFNFTKFNITGGIDGGGSADYNVVNYTGRQVSATGPKFNLFETPSKVTSWVKYQTSLKLALSIHFRVKVGKFFNINENTPSLDLTYLLLRLPARDRTTPDVDRSVSTALQSGCVLIPNMTLTFSGPNGGNAPIQTGDLSRGTVTLVNFQSTSDATITLECDPPAPGFPTSATIRAGRNSVDFPFTVQNQCILGGNPDNPNETTPPSPISAVQTYLVTAKLSPPSTAACTVYEIEAPLNITNRVIKCQAAPNTAPGKSPRWDDRASATIKADIDEPNAPPASPDAALILSFDYRVTETPAANVPVMFTLLDENRLPYSGSTVQVIAGGTTALLKPSATINMAIPKPGSTSNLTILWSSKGRYTGYANRFYLLVNAGCQYGQTEFWLDVYNWS
jgi:hypothetical protein